MPRTPGAKNKPKKLPDSSYDSGTIAWAKAEVLRLFDAGTIDDLSAASEHVGVSKLTLYAWRKSDKAWRQALNQAEQPIADRMLKEILQETVNGKNISMPYVTARLFRIKKIRPEYRDAYKFVVEDSRVLEHLEALKKLATQNKTDSKGGMTDESSGKDS